MENRVKDIDETMECEEFRRLIEGLNPTQKK